MQAHCQDVPSKAPNAVLLLAPAQGITASVLQTQGITTYFLLTQGITTSSYGTDTEVRVACTAWC